MKERKRMKIECFRVYKLAETKIRYITKEEQLSFYKRRYMFVFIWCFNGI